MKNKHIGAGGGYNMRKTGGGPSHVAPQHSGVRKQVPTKWRTVLREDVLKDWEKQYLWKRLTEEEIEFLLSRESDGIDFHFDPDHSERKSEREEEEAEMAAMIFFPVLIGFITLLALLLLS